MHVHGEVECGRAAKGGNHFLGTEHSHKCSASDQRKHFEVVDVTDETGVVVDVEPIIHHNACMLDASRTIPDLLIQEAFIRLHDL